MLPKSSLARRERDWIKRLTEVELTEVERIPVEPVVVKAADPVVVQVPKRPRIAFMEVVRDQFGEIAGLRPIYEE